MKRKTLISLHKKIGLSSIAVIIMLVLTGILLNHNDSLKFNQQPVHSTFLNNWYGIQLPQVEQGFQQQQNWVTLVGNTIFINQTPLQNIKVDSLHGFQTVDFGFILVSKNSLILADEQAQLIDQIPFPTPLANAYFLQGQLLLKLENNRYYQTLEPYDSLNEVSLSPNLTSNLVPISPSRLPTSLQATLQAQSNQNGLTVERLLLDIHSGRFFGSWGIYLIDLFAILFLLLALSGAWMTIRAGQKKPKIPLNQKKR